MIILDTSVLLEVGVIGENPVIMYEVLLELDRLKGKMMSARRAISEIKDKKDSIKLMPPMAIEGTVDHKIMVTGRENGWEVATNDIALSLLCEANGVRTQEHKKDIDVGLGYHWVRTPSEIGRGCEVGEYNFLIDEVGFVEGVYYIDKPGSGISLDEDIAIRSSHTKTIRPLDEFQWCAFDSLQRNDFTILTGSAGSGKTLLSLSWALQQISTGKASKLVIFTNPTKTRGAQELGFYKGDRNAKLMQDSIGSILSSKLGSMIELERMIEDEMIIILPMSDIRGYEVPEDAILYITEAQNTSADLMKLALQRVGDTCQVIVEGDPFTQLDNKLYSGESNGMIRAIQVFKGHKGFSHVHLPTVRRSVIAEIAEKMTETQ